MRIVGLRILLLVEAEGHVGAADQNRPFDEVRLSHHQVDGFSLRLRERPGLEHGAPAAHEIQKVRLIDMPFQKRAVRRGPVDVTFVQLDALLLQKTSGVATGRSSGFPVEGRLGHKVILPLPYN